MSTAVMEPAPGTEREAGWVYITDVRPSFTAGLREEIIARGHGSGRVYAIPAGRLRRVGRESVALPDLDDLI